MKSYMSIGLFIALGLFTAILIGFPNLSASSQLPYDYEQKGLGKEIVIKFSYVVAQNTPKGLAAQKFAQLVNEKTKGRVKVELYPDGTLYNEFDEFDALQQGNVQMIAPSFSTLAQNVPIFAVMDLPFAFPNDKAVQAALNGEIGQELLQSLAQQKVKGLAFWGNGFRQISNNKRSIIQPPDFTGLQFRIEPSKVMEAQFQTLNAIPTAIPFNQLYHKLELGLIDGEENSISNIYSKKFYQYQKYLTLCNESYLGYVVMMSQDFWNRIPTDFQKEIMDAMNETTGWEIQKAIELNQLQLQELRKIPAIHIYELTSSEKQEWTQALDPLYNQFEPILGKNIVDQIREQRKKYENGSE